ncbi:MAG: hypothetical protein HQK79_17180 [Desulfobacterales bacterium]|nr:hypothetical protein [Desulfobacterales bacterium]MBF0395339.1 hypothetical protein [Desulfobacterales bacterium]
MKKIAITGTQYYWGNKALTTIKEKGDIESIISLDINPPKQKDVKHIKLTFKKPFHTEWVKSLEKISPDILIMCPFGPDHCYQENLDNHINWSQNSLRIFLKAVELEIPKIIVLSSNLVYGPRYHNPAFLTEDSLLLGDRNFQRIRSFIELEEACLAALSSKLNRSSIIILRSATALGKTIDNFMTRFCKLPIIPLIMGFDPVLQFIHEDDVVLAIIKAIESKAKGPINIAGRGFISCKEFFDILEKPTIPIFHSIANYISKRLWRWNLTEFSPALMSILRFRMVVDTKKSEEELNFIPKNSMQTTILEFKETL